MRKPIIILFISLILLVPIVYAGGYWEYLTKGLADTLYCSIYGCTMEGNITFISGSGIVNATYYEANITNFIGEHWVNETLEIGNQTFKSSDEDVELRLLSDSNKNSFLYFMESSINGFRFMYDGGGTNLFKFQAIDAGVINTLWQFNRDTNETEFFANIDMSNSNITNVDCIEVGDDVICGWDEVNGSTYTCQNTSNITCYYDGTNWIYHYNGTLGSGSGASMIPTQYVGSDCTGSNGQSKRTLNHGSTPIQVDVDGITFVNDTWYNETGGIILFKGMIFDTQRIVIWD